MRVVCLDTQILIWGIKKEASDNRKHMIARATLFLDALEKQKTVCIVPAPVIAELLLKLSPSKHHAFIGDMSQRFIIPPFDANTSAFMARVWRSKHGQVDLPRQLIRYDSLIVAVALSAHASCIYSEDEDIEKIAAGHIEFKRMPEMHQQEIF
jgi:predicted nucleic acid-binding protein